MALTAVGCTTHCDRSCSLHNTTKQIDEDYYKNEGEDSSTFERILHWYVDYFGSSPGGVSILFPIGALRALRRLMSFRLVLFVVLLLCHYTMITVLFVVLCVAACTLYIR